MDVAFDSASQSTENVESSLEEIIRVFNAKSNSDSNICAKMTLRAGLVAVNIAAAHVSIPASQGSRSPSSRSDVDVAGNPQAVGASFFARSNAAKPQENPLAEGPAGRLRKRRARPKDGAPFRRAGQPCHQGHWRENFGVYTKFSPNSSGRERHVYSIEPVPLTYEILTANLKRLKLCNVEPFNLAISDDDGEVPWKFRLTPPDGENFYEAHIIRYAERQRPARHRSAGQQATRFAIRPLAVSIDFVKCDVEGHELACLHGAKSLLSGVKPAWLIEISGNPDSVHIASAADVFRIMARHGYMPFWFDGRHLRQRERGDRSVNYFFPQLGVHLRLDSRRLDAVLAGAAGGLRIFVSSVLKLLRRQQPVWRRPR